MLYRYIVKNYGGGIFTAIDALYPESSFAEIEDYDEFIYNVSKIWNLFEGLKSPEIHEISSSWFTEYGNEYFKEGIEKFKEFFIDDGVDCIVRDENVSEDKIIYKDKYQVIIKS